MKRNADVVQCGEDLIDLSFSTTPIVESKGIWFLGFCAGRIYQCKTDDHALDRNDARACVLPARRLHLR